MVFQCRARRIHGSRWRSRLLAALVLTLSTWPAAFATAKTCPDGHKRILVLFSQRSDFGFSSAAADRFIQDLRDGLKGCLDDYSEYLDAARFGDPAYLPILRDFLERKYAGVRFDLLVTLQRPALTFALQEGPNVFPDTPVFFVAGKGLETANDAPAANFGGVLYKVDLRRTVDVALTLQPSLRRIYVVSGDSPFDRAYEQGAREQFHDLADRIELQYLTGLPLDELDATIRHLPKDSMIYLMSVTADRSGRRFLRSDITSRIAAASNVPVYSPYAVFMDLGIVGGSLVSVDRVLREAAAPALRMLRGESARAVGVREVDPNVLQFDWRQLRRWRLSEAQLPPGSVVLFRRPGLWEQHRATVIGALALVGMQTALISGLLIQRRKRRHAETAMRDLAGRLLTAGEAERTRIARDIHDGICQELASLAIEAASLKAHAPALGDEERQFVSVLQQRISDVGESLRQLSHDLHPAVLQHVGLVAALETHCADVERQHGMQVRFVSRGGGDPGDAGLALALYRMAQEALRNATIHGRARRATVALVRRHRMLRLSVRDDGAGFDPAAVRRSDGLGLVSMEERARMVNARLSVRSAPGAGTAITIRVILEAAEIDSYALGES